MKLCGIIIALLCFPIFSIAQVTIEGKVTNKEGERIKQANVFVRVKTQAQIISFTSTNSIGNYSLRFNSSADSVEITVTSMNIGKHVKIVANCSQTLNFSVDEKAIVLKESKVTPIKAHRVNDTVNYLVSAFADQNDRVIADVLKKMPGIEVSESGVIKYNGLEINKFYVENMDLLQGRYGIATNNISAKDVLSVQVLENHQPIKALKDRLFTDRAAINLRLKQDAKGIVSINSMLGMGYKPLLWAGELSSMYFSKKRQHMNLYKGNNTGDNVTRELQSHYDFDNDFTNGGTLSLASPSTPPIPEKRFLFNQINSFSLNNIVNMKNYTLNANGYYYNEHKEKDSYSISEFYLPRDSTLTFSERFNTQNYNQQAEFNLHLEANHNKYYLSNRFVLLGNWNKGTSLGNTSEEEINHGLIQKIDQPYFRIINISHYIKNSEKNSYDFLIRTGYEYRPQQLDVESEVYSIFLPNIRQLKQKVHTHDLFVSAETSYSYKKNNFEMQYGMFGRFDHNMTNSELIGIQNDGVSIMDDSLKNNLNIEKAYAGIRQTYTYKRNRLKLSASIPISYNLFVIKDIINDSLKTIDKINAYINGNLLYELTRSLSIDGNVDYGQYNSITPSSRGYIMNDYRNFRRDLYDRTFISKTKSYRGSFSYREPLYLLFTSIGTNYKYLKSNMMLGNDFSGIINIKEIVELRSITESFGVNGIISKGTNFLSSNIRLSGSYTLSNDVALVQGKAIDFRAKMLFASSELLIYPFSFISINYKLTANQFENYPKNEPERVNTLRTINQTFNVNVFPTKKLTLTFNYETTYNNGLEKTYRYISFADVRTIYKNRQSEIEFLYTNILNRDKYISMYNSDVNSFFYSYNLRPRSILLKIRFKLK